MEIYILRGIPGSGKTTWAKKWVKDNPRFKRISKDDIRRMMDDGLYSEKNEFSVTRARDSLLISLAISGFSVVVDDTNINVYQVKHLRVIGSILQALTCVVDFYTPLGVCLARNDTRPEMLRVPEDRIREMHSQYKKVIDEECENGVYSARIVMYQNAGM